jgi:hypothetical protein
LSSICSTAVLIVGAMWLEEQLFFRASLDAANCRGSFRFPMVAVMNLQSFGGYVKSNGGQRKVRMCIGS